MRASVLALVLSILSILPFSASGGETAAPKIVVVLVDGLGPELVTPDLMPHLSALASSAGATSWTAARAVMPSVTNTNHVSLLTGVYAAAHGITGNYYGTEDEAPEAAALEQPEQILVQTLFTAVERRRPGLVTALVAGKAKLARLFSAGGAQMAPDHLWSDDGLGALLGRMATTDERTMSEALRILDANDPDFLFVGLAGVDRSSHAYGPRGEEARRAVAAADEQIGRLVAHVRTTTRWARTILFVTADHSFTSLAAVPGRPRPMISLGDALGNAGLPQFFVVADGTLAHVYRRGHDPDGKALRQAARVFRELPAVDEVLARVPDAEGKIPGLDEAHPDWRASHTRIGDLVVTARPGHHFNDPFRAVVAGFRGQHGGSAERPIPMMAAGGHPWLREGTRRLEAVADNADLGATLLALLGLGPPRDVSGEVVPGSLRGRVLREPFGKGLPGP